MTVAQVAATVALAAVLSARAETATPLRASSDSLTLENQKADEQDLSRMRDSAMLKRFARAGLLVPVPNQTRHYYLRNIPSAYRYLRPWSKLFLTRLSKQFHARFAKRLRVTSLVRTATMQRSLRKRNSNAAPAEGPRRSSHLTGATLDISKKGMTGKELTWMRRVLGSLKDLGLVHAIEEFQQSAFHVMVHKDYWEYAAAKSP